MKDWSVSNTSSFGVRLAFLIPLFVFAVFLGFLLELIVVEKLNLLVQIPLAIYNSHHDNDRDEHSKSQLAPLPLSASSELFLEKRKPDLSKWEGTTLLNITDFKWLRNNESLCRPEGKRKTVVFPVLVHSARSHFSERMIIRKSWGSLLVYKKWSIRLVFLLGKADRGVDPSRNEKQFLEEEALLDREESLFGDIVEGSFIDSYKNLTYKHIMGYKWILNFCSNAQFVMKADDDMFIDIKRFLDWITTDLSAEPSSSALSSTEEDKPTPSSPPDLYCNTFVGTKPQRCVGCKWYASTSEWPQDYYPDYCSGWCYSLTLEMIRKLYSVIDNVDFFWVDDVFATGILMEEVKRVYIGFQPTVKHLWGQVRSLDFRNFRPMCEHLDMKMKRKFKTVVPIARGSNFARDMMCLWNKTLYDDSQHFKMKKNDLVD